MNWIYYLLEANLYLIIFYSFYRLFLAKETFYTLNRAYLIITSTLAFILPFVQLGILKNPIEIAKTLEIPPALFQDKLVSAVPLTEIKSNIFNTENLFLGVYLLITIILISKLIFNICKILMLKKSAIVVSQKGIKIIELNNAQKAFSFFNLLFINSNLEQKDTVIKHEMVHINQRHSYDILFFEIVQAANWFNPIIYFIKKDIRLLHEYLADAKTTEIDIEKYDYALFLIKNSSGFENLQLTNQIFNSSVLKQRITMLNQKKSGGRARLKVLLVLPLIIVLIGISTLGFTKDYGYVNLFPNIGKKENNKLIIDSTIIREVLMKSELVATKLSPKNSKWVNLTADSRDFFKVYLHNTAKNESILELDWSLVLERSTVVQGDFYNGTAGFSKVGEAISAANLLNKKLKATKYGDLDKLGAVELTGDKIKLNQIKRPLPPAEPNSPPLPPIKLNESKILPPLSLYKSPIVINRSKGFPYPVYFNKVKVMTGVKMFSNLPANKDYVGIILLASINNNNVPIEKISTDCDFLEIRPTAMLITSGKNFPIDVVIKNPSKGSISQNVLVYLKGEKYPIKIPIVGDFI